MQKIYQASLPILMAALLVLPGNVSVCAQTVVLMPVADLSKGGNGVDFAFTQSVETTLKQLNVELVSSSDVMLFMAKNKIRTNNYLDNYLVKILGSEFDSSLVLTGTITEQDTEPPSVGVIFTALDTMDGTPVWSVTRATSVKEQVRMLGVGEPATTRELFQPILRELLAPFAKLVQESEALESRDYQLLGMHLFPGYVRSGQEIEARLKIRFLGKRPSLIAAESVVGKVYLLYDRRSDSYQGKWFSPEAEGSYKVDLRLEWGRDRTVEKVRQVASFQVLNKAQGLTIEIKKGLRVGQRLAFNRHLLILPRVGDPRPMSGWALEIKKANGDQVVYEEYAGEIPERMVWEGRGSDGFKLANGGYEIVMHIWDLAGNQSTASRRVIMQSSAPRVVAGITRISGEASLDLKVEGKYPFPLVSWQSVLKTVSGEVLLQEKGEELPVSLNFKPPEDEDYVLLTVTGEDLLGNRLNIKRQKLPVIDVDKQIEEKKAESWVPDF